MISLSRAAEAIGAEVAFQATDYQKARVSYVVACDLMSDVLVVDKDHILLLTSLVSRQSLKTAHLVGASAICFVNDKVVPDDLPDLARELDLTVLRTPLDKFMCCVKLGKVLGINRSAQPTEEDAP